jgi:6-phosphogluconolactonase (cycloisomerase 2 family)
LLGGALSVIPLGCSGGGSATKTAAPTVSVTAAPTSVTLGGSTTVTWSSTNATSCTASGAWSGTQNTSGSAAETPAATGTATYTLTCTGNGGSTNASASVTVNAPASATVTISVSPTTVNEGNSATLTWSSTNATSCIASGAWSGTQSNSGSESVSPTPAGSYTYTLACNGAGGNASSSATLTVNATPAAFVYTTDGDTVAGFGEAQGTGQLSPLANSPFNPGFTNLIALLPDPAMGLLFVVSAETTTTVQGTVTSFTVDPSTGNLTPTGNSMSLPDAPTANDLVLGPGNVLYVTSASSATIMAYSIASGGVLTALPGSPYSVPCIGAFCGNDNTPGEMFYDAADKTLYVVNTEDWTVATFSVATNGALTYIANTVTGADVPESIVISPNGANLYAPNQLSNNISAFSITPSATLNGNPEPLTPLTGQPFANPNGASPDSPAIEPTGQYLYVNNNGAQTISAFSISQSGGTPTPLSSSPFAITGGAGGNNQLVIDPTGAYLYVANQTNAGNISGFSIDPSSGALTQLSGSPYAMGSGVTVGPAEIVIYNPNP